ncbi:MAG TPA: oligosaccharide flippase family protein [Patescibacteria group bacterium]|nr:oligosaccharide flippase family protein [Patescibacteria group bacterium]
MVKKIYSHFMHDSLYRNSIYLMLSTFITAGFGSLFWILAARFVSADQIGIATAIISTSTFIMQFSLFGLKNSIVRYLPKSVTKNAKINTGANFIIIVSLLLSVSFLLLLPLISPPLLFLRNNSIYSFLFILFCISFTLNQFQEGVFVAYRSTGYVVIKNALWGVVKVVLPFFLYGLGSFGIFLAFGFGSIISTLFGIIILIIAFHFQLSPFIRRDVIQKMGKFSFGNYLGTVVAYIPQFVLPIIILNNIGPKENAYYYIDQQIANLLYIIPIATTQSLFAEGSHDENSMKQHVKKSLFFIFLLMIPSVGITIFMGSFVLHIFGHQYAGNGLQFLQLLAFSALFVSINNVGTALLNIRKKVITYILLNIIAASLFIGFSFLFLSLHLLGIGYAWLIAQGVLSCIYVFLLRKTIW